MKRILILAFIAVFVMMPLASFAKTAISDSELNSVMAQQGVTITTNLSISGVNITTVSWGDTGFGSTYTSNGFVGLSNITLSGTVVGLSGDLLVEVGSSGAVTKIQVGLPTVSLGSMNVDAIAKVSTIKTLTDTQVLGSVYMSGLSATITGTVTVFAH